MTVFKGTGALLCLLDMHDMTIKQLDAQIGVDFYDELREYLFNGAAPSDKLLDALSKRFCVKPELFVPSGPLYLFFDKYLAGDALEYEIDEAISEWHNGASLLKLHEYLGMSWDEYVEWTSKGNECLPLLARARSAK